MLRRFSPLLFAVVFVLFFALLPFLSSDDALANGEGPFSRWKATSQAIFSKFSARYQTKVSPATAAVQAFAKLEAIPWLATSELITEESYWDFTFFDNPRLPVKLHVMAPAQEPAGAKTKAPLVVFFPGTFTDAHSPQVRHTAKFFSEAGNRTLILPNPWSPGYLKAWPMATSGDIRSEARVAALMIKYEIESRLGPENVSRVEFYGESYGAFLAAATAARFNEMTGRTVGSVTLVSFPLDFRVAMSNLDQMIERQEKNYFDRGCRDYAHGAFSRVEVAYESLVEKDPRDISEDIQKCSEALFVYSGFQEFLVSSGKLMNERRAAHSLSKVDDTNWERKLRFQDYMKAFFPEAYAKIVQSDQLSLLGWVEKVNKQKIVVRGLIAEDDPLNRSDSLKAQLEAFLGANPSILRLHFGGHLGFILDPLYRALMVNEFGFGEVQKKAYP